MLIIIKENVCVRKVVLMMMKEHIRGMRRRMALTKRKLKKFNEERIG
jgi:hypothetical protein